MLETDFKVQLSKIQGCLLGGALGDALGGRYEGRPPPLDVAWGPPWMLSDDTQLTLATCESIIEHGRPDPESIAAAMVKRHQDERITGLGAATRGALDALVCGGHWALVGRRGEMAAGNGAAMRVAPLAFFIDPGHFEGRQLIRDVARITHHSEEAYVGALAITIAIRAAFFGRWSGDGGLLRLVVGELPDSRVRDQLMAIIDSEQVSIESVAEQFGSSGYVVESVPLALFAVQQVESLGFAKVLEAVVQAGGDTDTNASMAGQVAGCLLGINGLPKCWSAKVPDRDLILHVGDKLCECLR